LDDSTAQMTTIYQESVMSKFLCNLNIGKRLTLGFSIILLSALMAMGLAISKLGLVANSAHELLNDPLTTERLISDWYRMIEAGTRRTLAIVKSKDAGLGDFFRDEIIASSATIDKLQRQIEPHIQSLSEKKTWEAIHQARADYMAVRAQVMALEQAGRNDEAALLIDQRLVQAGRLYSAHIQEMLNDERQRIDVMADGIQQVYLDSRVMMQVLTAALVAFVALCAWLMTTSITRPLARAVDLARQVAAGDLSAESVALTKDETGKLLGALDDMRRQLAQLVGGVRLTTETISVAAKQIAAGNMDLSTRTENQASALEETASSMEELTSAVRQNAHNAQHASALVNKANEIAAQGGQVIDQVIQNMDGIRSSSRQITEIIGVIEAIAFQTNILALNAAVEAARAGEQGRGFAVVASEVRNLAQRSAGAAKEIKVLIDGSVSQVERGNQLVDQAGLTMTQIMDSVQQAAVITGEISDASREQSQGIEQINQTVTQIDHITQQNSALVEEAAAAAASLEEQASNLVEAISVFKTVAVRPAVKSAGSARSHVRPSHVADARLALA